MDLVHSYERERPLPQMMNGSLQYVCSVSMCQLLGVEWQSLSMKNNSNYTPVIKGMSKSKTSFSSFLIIPDGDVLLFLSSVLAAEFL